MRSLGQKGEISSILAVSALVIIGIVMMSSSVFLGQKQTTSSRANAPQGTKICYDSGDTRCGNQTCKPEETCERRSEGAFCCKTSIAVTPIAQDPCGGNNKCQAGSGGGNDCTNYLESVTAVGITDGGVMDGDTLNCDIVTKNICDPVRTDKDNICGVKINDSWPQWCPWNGVLQDLCGSTIRSSATCDVTKFKDVQAKPGDKLQVVAARKYGTCDNIPWDKAGNFIAGQTFYYKQKSVPQPTTPPQPQPTSPPASGGNQNNQGNNQPAPTQPPANQQPTGAPIKAGTTFDMNECTNIANSAQVQTLILEWTDCGIVDGKSIKCNITNKSECNNAIVAPNICCI